MENIVVLCTVPSEEVGRALGRSLVSASLAACVNLVPGVTSIYRWKGEVQEDAEVQLLIKTRASLLPAVREHITRNHPYEVPEILALDVAGGSPRYLGWIAEETAAADHG